MKHLEPVLTPIEQRVQIPENRHFDLVKQNSGLYLLSLYGGEKSTTGLVLTKICKILYFHFNFCLWRLMKMNVITRPQEITLDHEDIVIYQK